MILVLLAIVAPWPALAGDSTLSGFEGHPRSRFPLSVWAQPSGDVQLDAAVRRAIDDWNALCREALGLDVFTTGAVRELARVRIHLEPATAAGLMGLTHLRTDDTGVIEPPVGITVVEPAASGQTSRETLLYQVVAHELGHALGLPHMNDAASLMCCDANSLNFDDPAVRAAYIQARRHPDVRSALDQLAAHYRQFWGQ